MWQRVVRPIWQGAKAALVVFPAYLMVTDTIADFAFVAGTSMQVSHSVTRPVSLLMGGDLSKCQIHQRQCQDWRLARTCQFWKIP